MGTTDSPHLAQAGAVWSPGPQVGGWIAERLGPFGPSVGHAVPHGYPAYAVMPLWQAEETDGERSTRLAPLLEVLKPFTGSQPVHCGMWDGFGWIYGPDRDPRNAPENVGVWWPPGTERPSQADIDQARLKATAWLAQRATAAPGLPLLELPHRSYHLWTGPLAAALAFEHQPDPPSLIWPEDRSWFLGAPIYTDELALGATQDIVDAVLKDSRLKARSAVIGEDLDGDD